MRHRFMTSVTPNAVLLALLWLLAGVAHAERDTRVYPLSERPAEDIASQIRALYPDDPITVTARGQQLIVRGEPRLLDEIGTLIDTMDVALAQLRISVRTREHIGGKRSGAGLSVDDQRAGVSVERKVTRTGGDQVRTLVVQDGQTAHITSGQIRTLPFALRGGRHPAAILEQVETRSGVLVTPRVLSDRAIELNIVSFDAEPPELDGYETEALMTLRRVEPGQWISLGGVATEHSGRERGLVYEVNSSASRQRTVEVRIDLLP